MADRKDYFFRQVVTEAELDSGFAYLEQADFDLAIDSSAALVDLSAAPTIDGGIRSGLAVTNPSSFNLQVSGPGAAYDHLGRRIGTAGNLTVDVTVTGETAIGAGGTPTGGTSTDPGAGLLRWISLFVRFDRLLTDPRTDGASTTVYFDRAESFVFKVTMGATHASNPVKPPLEAGMILLADARRSQAAIDTLEAGGAAGQRRQDWLVREDATLFAARKLRTGRVRTAISNVLEWFNAHVNNTTPADKHAATAVDYAGGATWADGTTNPAASVEAQLDKIITDLTSTTAAGGGGKVQGVATTGTAGVAAVPGSLTAGTLKAQLDELLSHVNSRLSRGGDTITGNLVPDATGKDLGSAGARFDAFLQTLDIAGAVLTNFIPNATAQDLGSTSARWDAFLEAVTVYGSLLPNTTGVDLGSAGARFDAFLEAVTIYGSLLPSADGTLDLGSVSFTWKDVWAVSHRLSPSPSVVYTVPATEGRFESDWVDVLGTTTTTTRDNVRTTATPAGDTNSFTVPIDRGVPDGATITSITVTWTGQSGDTLKFAAYREANGTTDARTVLDAASSAAGTGAIIESTVYDGSPSVSIDRDAESLVVVFQGNRASGALDIRIYCVKVTFNSDTLTL